MKIGIIGAGKVGISIGYVLKQKGMDIAAVSDISEASIIAAKTYLGDKVFYTTDNVEVVKASDIIAVTTQDRIIKEVAIEITGKMEKLDGKLFFHTSGAHSSELLSPLETKGARLGALHPLQTFPDIDSAINVLSDTFIFIEGGEDSIDALHEIGTALGSGVIRMKGEQKLLYHLCAVIVCNLLCALLYTGEDIMDKIGIELQPFFPIIKATLNNIENKGPLMSLTGPIVRGDVETVLSHIEAMEDMELYKKVYKSLSLVALDMAKERGDIREEALEKLKHILK
ncbi:MAG: DUF2520 domain-containing protein [Proteobacteria bacterium]|nr:DUF2520 domain-containing protein [Pseudomonadota bacterium]